MTTTHLTPVDIEEAPPLQIDRSQVPGLERKCFPCRCLPCCCLAPCLPNEFIQLQGWTHLVLVVGTWVSFGMVGISLLNLFGRFPLWPACATNGTFCFREVVIVVYVLPICLYFFSVIKQYDERMQAKSLALRMQKEEAKKAYSGIISDMDGFLTKSAESSAGLAERSFESKRRDFQRFLDKVRKQAGRVQADPAQRDELLREFKRFVHNWLLVFRECSLDPVKHPKVVVSDDEINRCGTIGEVAELVLERLKLAEVRFISAKLDEDQRNTQKHRLALTGSFSGGTPVCRRPQMSPNEEEQDTRPRQQRCPAWVAFGAGGFRCKRQDGGNDGFPIDIGFGCGRIVILSKEHLLLIMGVIVGIILFAFEFRPHDDPPSALKILQVVVIEICIIFVLNRFEELDILQQLEREVRELQQANEQAIVQREQMQKFWSGVQQTTDLWLHRTVPRLDVYQELHGHLQDNVHESVEDVRKANENLEALERACGAIEMWTDGAQLQGESKVKFSKHVSKLVEANDFNGLMEDMDALTKRRSLTMKPLTDVPQSRPSRGY